MKKVLLLALAAAGSALGADKVDFEREIKPILQSACVSCHSGEKPKGALQLTTRAGTLKGGDKGPAFVAGKPDKSPLYTSTILPPGHDDIMPPKGAPLTKVQTDLLRRWIEEGADWPESSTLKTVRRVDFAKDVKPVLELNCVACHREGHVKGGLRLDTRAEAFKGGDSGAAILSGNAARSLILTSMTAGAEDEKLMPPKAKGGPLSKEITDLIRDWIEQGALWPEELVLVPRKAEESPAANEAVTVADIHKMIMSNLKVMTEAEMKAYTNLIPGTKVKYAMVPIPGGQFQMGSPETESGRQADEGPRHPVKIAPFWMGKYEVTWNEFELFMYPDEERKFKSEISTDPYVDKVSDAVARPTKPYVEMSFGMGKDGYPAISMTQHAANKYCQWLSAKTGEYYRLPTEAEWEYACRAGSATAYAFGDDPEELQKYAWFESNSDFKYQRVGRKAPNAWGLHDMHGNVAEWCLDQYNADYYKEFTDKLAAEPWNKATTPYPHVARGGSWDDPPAKLRSAARRGSDKSWKGQDPQLPKSIWYLTDAQFLGFRIVRPLKVPGPEELSKYWTSGVERE